MLYLSTKGCYLFSIPDQEIADRIHLESETIKSATFYSRDDISSGKISASALSSHNVVMLTLLYGCVYISTIIRAEVGVLRSILDGVSGMLPGDKSPGVISLRLAHYRWLAYKHRR